MNAVISETLKAAILGLCMQTLETSAQRKFDRPRPFYRPQNNFKKS